jgi:hypothetical protein
MLGSTHEQHLTLCPLFKPFMIFALLLWFEVSPGSSLYFLPFFYVFFQISGLVKESGLLVFLSFAPQMFYLIF